ncbi:MAG: hypothetical protein AAGD09_25065 [Cyanobacteria bacterium P01_F01_bin.56]
MNSFQIADPWRPFVSAFCYVAEAEAIARQLHPTFPEETPCQPCRGWPVAHRVTA